MKLETALFYPFVFLLILVVVIASAIAFGGPKTPPSMDSINNPFKAVDFSDLPALQYFKADDGASLAYRAYIPSDLPPRGSIVLVHGSSASSNSMHVLAKAFLKAEYAAYAVDIRGHGASGSKGKIAYIGQLEDDLASFVREISPVAPSTLAGFSAGGGFALRFAGGNHQGLFASYLLLSPYLGHNAPNYRPSSGGWVNVGVPRIIALSALNVIGVSALNGFPVISFALNEEAKKFLTPEYSFALAENFGPHHEYEKDIMAVHQPCAVIAGADDEAFYTDKLEPTFRLLGKSWPVTLLPGVAHIPLTLEPKAVAAVVMAVEALRANGV